MIRSPSVPVAIAALSKESHNKIIEIITLKDEQNKIQL